MQNRCYSVTTITTTQRAYNMCNTDLQQLKTITKTETTTELSVHAETVYALMLNAFKNLSYVEEDCTGASAYIAQTNIFAQLQDLYCSFAQSTEYVSLASVMQCFTNNITYTDETWLYTDVVNNTVLESVKLQDYTYLSN